MIANLYQDLRYAVRTLRRSPGFTAMVVLSLSLGMGANGAIFGLVNAVLLRTMPVRDPERLVLFSEGFGEGRKIGPPRPGRLDAYSYPLYERLRGSDAFEGVLAQQTDRTSATVKRSGQADESIDLADGRAVSANYFSVLGVPAYRGRTFAVADETAPGADHVLVLSHAYWQQRFGGDPALIGSPLLVNGRPYNVIGVTPPGFTGIKVGSPTDFWVPLTMQSELMRAESRLHAHDEWWLLVMGRLKPRVSMAAAEARVNLALQQFLAEHPTLVPDVAACSAVRVTLESGATGASSLRRSFRQPLLVLMAGVALLFLIVCLNLSHLMLARTIQRQREMSIRTALGASRARLVQQMLTEGSLLSLAGAAGATLTTSWLRDGILLLAVAADAQRALDVTPDLRLLAFTAVLTLATATVLGLGPAWQTSLIDLPQALRATSHTRGIGGTRRLLSRSILASQVALSLVLLVGASLLAGTFDRLRNLDTGFDEEQLLLIDINPRIAGVRPAEALVLYDEIVRGTEAIPGVRAASLSLIGPLAGGGAAQNTGTISVPGAAPPKEPMVAQFGIVTSGYFDTVGMTVVRGRGFTRDDREHGPRIAVINETMARQCFGGEDAVGKRFRDGNPGDIEVVGIVKNARVNGLRHEPRPTAYLLVAQLPHLLGSLEVRTAADPERIAEQVRRVVREAHPGVPITNVKTMHAQVERSLRQERVLAVLSSVFGVASLLLVSIGLYGVVSEWAGQRTREIGLRMALGATAAGVRWMVLREGFAVVALGVVIGLPAAAAASRLLTGLLFGLSPTDPTALAAASVTLFGVAAAAAYLPARGASRMDPMVALRTE
jgi:predicted permease